MKLIWTKSNLPLSLFIRWGLKQDCSHFAIVFDDDNGGIVFESNLLGTHIKWFPTFKDHCAIVHEIEVKLPLKKEEAIYQATLSHYDDKSYDYKAFAYFCWRTLLLRLFNVALPKKNAWDSKGAYICVGLAKALRDAKDSLPKKLAKKLESVEDFEMVSPHDLFHILSD